MEETVRLAAFYRALSDPTRLRIVALLARKTMPDEECQRLCAGQGFLCVNALAHRLGVTQSAVSQHLRVLRLAGIVQGERQGSFVHYTVDSGILEQHAADLHRLLHG